jgi:hypothetical protein
MVERTHTHSTIYVYKILFELQSERTHTQALIDAGKEVSLEVNAEKTKYKLMFRHQNAGQNHNIKIANRSLKMWHRSTIGNNSNKSKIYS